MRFFWFFFALRKFWEYICLWVRQVYDLHGVVNSVAADGQSTPRLALMLVVLVVGGGVVGGLL